jgi:hypothetical protein
VQTLVDSGKISAEDAESHPRKNELIQVMGMTPAPTPHVCAQPLRPTDDEVILLCTDGLYNMMSRQDIHAILSRSGYIEDKGAELMRTALDNGGYDNITFQLIKFFNLENTTERTDQTPVNAIDADEAAAIKRTPVALAILSVLVIILGVLMYLKEAKKNAAAENNSAVSAPSDQVAIYDVTTRRDADSIGAIYGLQLSQVETITQPDGRMQMRIPVRKIHVVRFYDDLHTIERLYGVPKEKIKKVNGIKGDVLEPAREIIIPL